MYSFPLERAIKGVTNYLCLPFMQTSTEENESITDTWKFFDQSVSNGSSSDMDIWNHVWNQLNVTNVLSAADRQTWECFGEAQSIKELMFITDTPVATIHLEKIKQMNNFSLLSEKVNFYKIHMFLYV